MKKLYYAVIRVRLINHMIFVVFKVYSDSLFLLLLCGKLRHAELYKLGRRKIYGAEHLFFRYRRKPVYLANLRDCNDEVRHRICQCSVKVKNHCFYHFIMFSCANLNFRLHILAGNFRFVYSKSKFFAQ